MRRVLALTASVLAATLIAGLAIAQDDEPEGGGDTADESAESTDEAGGAGASEAGGAGVSTPPAGGSDGSTSSSASSEDDIDAGTYAVRLRDLERRINELKEQIFRSKARLSLLAETVLSNVVAGAQAVIIHENRMSSSYRLVKAVYALDGARLLTKADEEGDLTENGEIHVYDGSIVPGDHTLTVNLEYRGNGYGIFSYLKGYRFRVRSNYTFSAPEGRAITIRVVGYEKGGPTAPLEERPAIRYMENVSSSRRRGGSEEEPGSGSGGGSSERSSSGSEGSGGE